MIQRTSIKHQITTVKVFQMQKTVDGYIQCPFYRFVYLNKDYTQKYRHISNIIRTLVGIKYFGHSDVVGASPIGAAPTTSSFVT